MASKLQTKDAILYGEISILITDDCISGYHVALPLTGHGASYVALQTIGSSGWERLKSSTPPALLSLTLRAQQRYFSSLTFLAFDRRAHMGYVIWLCDQNKKMAPSSYFAMENIRVILF